MTRCDSSACFCSCPPTRRVQSTRALYTMDELGEDEIHRAVGPEALLAHWDGARYFRYLYRQDLALQQAVEEAAEQP